MEATVVVVVGAAPAEGVAACPPDPDPDAGADAAAAGDEPADAGVVDPPPPDDAAPGAGAATAGALEDVDCGPVPGGAPGEIPSRAAINCAPSFSIPSAQMPTPRAPSLVTSC